MKYPRARTTNIIISGKILQNRLQLCTEKNNLFLSRKMITAGKKMSQVNTKKSGGRDFMRSAGFYQLMRDYLIME